MKCSITFTTTKHYCTYEYWVSDKEDWSVVSNKIPVSFVSIELYGKTTWVTGSVSTTRFTT